jgi:hypothetical protein
MTENKIMVLDIGESDLGSGSNPKLAYEKMWI